MNKINRKRMTTLVLLLVSAGCIWTAMADELSHMRKAERLLSLINMPELVNETCMNVINVQALNDPNFRRYEDIYRTFLQEYVTWNRLKPQFVELYTQEFTEEDLDVMIAFYETPTGRKTVEKSPLMLIRVAEIAQNAISANADKLDEMIQRRNAEFEAALDDLTGE